MSISVDNVTLGYDLHPAVHHRSLEIEEGSMVALVGPNGAGKSTLLKGIMGQLKLLGGSISLGQLNHSQIAYLPQLSQVDRSFPITVREMV
ncbi:ATP-binding cassette domain-containing protein, partial [Oleiphilus sp. HI0079]|uniref:ATP-binding cassette domain-containing protein n=2 Tax=Oleiphilus TaxID=141450 RepID=UPI000B1E065C